MKRSGTHPSKRTWRRGLAGFRRSESGATAVEFGLVAIPFFLLLFAIIEVAMFFFVGQILDNATNKAARLVRTGQAQTNGMDAGSFQAEICDTMSVLTSCNTSLSIYVQVYDSFSTAGSAYDPIDPATGELRAPVFNAGDSGDIIVVRAYYRWPVFFNVIPPAGAGLADGSRLLASVFAFRNEPF